jgi:hypothetical protein
MNRLVDEHAKMVYDLMQPPKQISMTYKEEYLIDILNNYDTYNNFGQYFNELLGVDII